VQRASKARRRGTKYKQGLVNPNTEGHNQAPALFNGKRKPRESGSWFVKFVQSTKKKQATHGRPKEKQIEGDVFNLVPTRADKIQTTKKSAESKGGVDLSLKRQEGESYKDYTLRLRQTNQRAIIEETGKASFSKSREKRKKFLTEQKQRKKRKRMGSTDSSDDEQVYEQIKFGERSERPPELQSQLRRNSSNCSSFETKRVVTLLETTKDSRFGGHGQGGNKNPQDSIYKRDQFEALKKRISSAYASTRE